MAVSIEEVKTLGDILPLNKWDFAVLEFPKAFSSPISSDELNLRCYVFTLPMRNWNDK